MGDIPLSRQLQDLWRHARRQGWTRLCRLQIGWRADDEPGARTLAKHVLKAGWHPSPSEEYEPEDDPAEFIAYTILRTPDFTELEERLSWAESVARDFGASIGRLSIGAAEHDAAADEAPE